MHHFKDVLSIIFQNFPSLPPKSAICKVNLVNYLQLIFKLSVLQPREKSQIKFVINKIKDAELKIIEKESRKCEKYCKKWDPFW